MTETKQDRWMTWVALTTAVMAVLAAITTLYMGKFSSRAILLQGQETNQWSYYQAKSIKSYLYEIQTEFMEMERLEGDSKAKKVNSQQFEKALTRYKDAVKRYDKEKAEIKAKGDQLAKEKVIAQDRGGKLRLCPYFPADRSHVVIDRRLDQEKSALVFRHGNGPWLAFLFPRCHPFILLTDMGHASSIGLRFPCNTILLKYREFRYHLLGSLVTDFLILVDENDNEVGYEEKELCHLLPTKRHRAFSIFIFNSAGKILIHKRSALKKTWPGFWTNACCSHPRKGESLEEATARRLQEELGFQTQLIHLFTFLYHADYDGTYGENEIDHVFEAFMTAR